MKIRAVIIDDERHSREALAQKLARYCPTVDVVGCFSDASEALDELPLLGPDLIFLDIEMPVMNGFELLKRLSEYTFQVIFVTAYNEFAIQAIRFSALDYLVKPVEVEELQQAVSRVNSRSQTTIVEQLRSLMNNLSTSGTRQSLAIGTSEGLKLVNLNEIEYLEAEGTYTQVYLHSSKILSSKPLADFEEALPSDRFFRIHNSIIIHLEFIRSYIRGEGGEVIMQSGKNLPVARRRKEELLERIKGFAGRV